MSDAILLLGHGSRDTDGVNEFLGLASAVRNKASLLVEAGVLEFASPVLPSIQYALDKCVSLGADRIAAVPVLLLEGQHAQGDMPNEIAKGLERFPQISLRLAPPLGIQKTLLEIIEDRIVECARNWEKESTAILLVGRGTTDAEANGDIYKIGRLLWERNHYPTVECSFSGTCAPLVPEGIERCVKLGAQRIIVAPYFINTGVLVKRIHTQAAEVMTKHPGVEIAVANQMGTHPKLVQLLLASAHSLINSSVVIENQPNGRTWRYLSTDYSHASTEVHSPHSHAQNGGPVHERI